MMYSVIQHDCMIIVLRDMMFVSEHCNMTRMFSELRILILSDPQLCLGNCT